jgi:heavy metal sensor kinase
MASEAKHISSQSLQARLPNPNPHDELGTLASVINDTLARLESSFSELRRFTADASHELRTPLTALRTVGEVALRGPAKADELRAAIESMLEEARRLSGLAESLLTLARLEGGGEHLPKESVDLSALIRETYESLRQVADEKGVSVQLSNDTAIAVRGDKLLLGRAIFNVLQNAIRYTPPGKIVSIRSARKANEAYIQVEDQGPGIDAKYQRQIFERFFRIDPSRSRADGGHGLGLAIAKWSIERHGGRIELQCEVGSGCTFLLCLPIP